MYDKVMNAVKYELGPYHIWSDEKIYMTEVHVSPVSRMRNESKLEWLTLELS